MLMKMAVPAMKNGGRNFRRCKMYNIHKIHETRVQVEEEELDGERGEERRERKERRERRVLFDGVRRRCQHQHDARMTSPDCSTDVLRSICRSKCHPHFHVW